MPYLNPELVGFFHEQRWEITETEIRKRKESQGAARTEHDNWTSVILLESVGFSI